MSSNSSNSGDHTKVYKLKSRKNFPAWKQKTLSLASSKGYERFLLKTVKVPTEDKVNGKEQDYIQETDKTKAKQYKKELGLMKKERKKSLAAAAMLTGSVRTKDLKMLKKCKNDPRKMFEVISNKYGTKEDKDLTKLVDEFNECKLKSRKHDPEDWFAELDTVNEQLGEIDLDFK